MHEKEVPRKGLQFFACHICGRRIHYRRTGNRKCEGIPAEQADDGGYLGFFYHACHLSV